MNDKMHSEPKKWRVNQLDVWTSGRVRSDHTYVLSPKRLVTTSLITVQITFIQSSDGFDNAVIYTSFDPFGKKELENLLDPRGREWCLRQASKSNFSLQWPKLTMTFDLLTPEVDHFWSISMDIFYR